MTIRVSKDRIDMDDKVLQKPVLKDYGEKVVYASGSTGYALDFDDNATVSISANSAFNTDSFSVGCWINPTSHRIQSIFDKTTFSTSWRVFMANTSGHFEFDALSDAYNLGSNSNALPIGTWSHIFVTYNKSTTTAVLYLNGVAVNTNASFTNAGNDQNLSFRISPPSIELDGLMDEVRFYNRAITAGEVTDIYNGSGTTSGLVGYWKFEEGSGSTTADASGNGHTGTISGTPIWSLGSGEEATIDLTEGNVHVLTLEGATALTFANPPASGTAGSFTLTLLQDAVGSRTVSWPGAVVWSKGITPTLQTQFGKADTFEFVTTDGGTTWYGMHSGATMLATRVYITAGTTWTVPSDWNSSNNTIEVIGGGGGGNSSAATGRGGGGGGGYSRAVNVSLTPGGTVGCAVGAAGAANASGGDTYLCNSTSSCTAITDGAVVAGAKGGNGGATFTGGSSASGVGTVKYSGGNGGTNGGDAGGGGGGAGGPRGNGGNGGAAGTTGSGGGGGGGGGSAGSAGSGSSGGAGGNSFRGVGGGAAGAPGSDGSSGGGGGGGNTTADGGNGGIGSEWDATHGSGGGGGAAGHDYNSAFPSGGLYGGGGGGKGNDANGSGGPGAQGIIVITYFPA